MKKPLAIQLEFDIKSVRRALALITGEAATDEEIIAKFFDREPIKIDVEEMLGEADALKMCIAFTAIIQSEYQPDKKSKESDFEKKLKQMAAVRKQK